MKIELFIAFDRDGSWKAGDTEEDAITQYTDEWKPDSAISVIKLDLDIETPPPLVLSAVVPFSVVSEVINITVSRAGS
jgi:hypothetical protein